MPGGKYHILPPLAGAYASRSRYIDNQVKKKTNTIRVKILRFIRIKCPRPRRLMTYRPFSSYTATRRRTTAPSAFVRLRSAARFARTGARPVALDDLRLGRVAAYRVLGVRALARRRAARFAFGRRLRPRRARRLVQAARVPVGRDARGRRRRMAVRVRHGTARRRFRGTRRRRGRRSARRSRRRTALRPRRTLGAGLLRYRARRRARVRRVHVAVAGGTGRRAARRRLRRFSGERPADQAAGGQPHRRRRYPW